MKEQDTSVEEQDALMDRLMWSDDDIVMQITNRGEKQFTNRGMEVYENNCYPFGKRLGVLSTQSLEYLAASRNSKYFADVLRDFIVDGVLYKPADNDALLIDVLASTDFNSKLEAYNRHDKLHTIVEEFKDKGMSLREAVALAFAAHKVTDESVALAQAGQEVNDEATIKGHKE